MIKQILQTMTIAHSDIKCKKLDHNKIIFLKNTWKKQKHEELAKERRKQYRLNGSLK